MAEFLTVRDVAPELGVSESRVYQLIGAQQIPAVRRGRAVRIPRRAWERWLDEQSQSALAGTEEKRG